LSDEFLVDGLVAIGSADALLEECQQDGDDDGALETFSEADEEDCRVVSRVALKTFEVTLLTWHCKDVHHGCGEVWTTSLHSSLVKKVIRLWLSDLAET
jgi:hypothetical protein